MYASLSSFLPSCVHPYASFHVWVQALIHIRCICVGLPLHAVLMCQPLSLVEPAWIPVTVYSLTTRPQERNTTIRQECVKSQPMVGSQPGHSWATLCSAALVVICHGILHFERLERKTSTRSDSTARRRRSVQYCGGVSRQSLFLSNSLWRVAILRLPTPCSASPPLSLLPPGFARTVEEITIHNRIGSESFNTAQIIQVVTGGKNGWCHALNMKRKQCVLFLFS